MKDEGANDPAHMNFPNIAISSNNKKNTQTTTGKKELLVESSIPCLSSPSVGEAQWKKASNVQSGGKLVKERDKKEEYRTETGRSGEGLQCLFSFSCEKREEQDYLGNKIEKAKEIDMHGRN